MPLQNPPSSSILYMNFNQDYTCVSIADFKGIKIYSLVTHKLCYVADTGAVRCDIAKPNRTGLNASPVMLTSVLVLLNLHCWLV